MGVLLVALFAANNSFSSNPGNLKKFATLEYITRHSISTLFVLKPQASEGDDLAPPIGGNHAGVLEIFKGGSGKVAMGICLAVTLGIVCVVVAFFGEESLWPLVFVLVPTATISKLSYELSWALNNRKQHNSTGLAASRNEKGGPKQIRHRRRRKSFSYPKFYAKVIQELSLYSTCGPGSRKNQKLNSGQTMGGEINELMKAQVIDLLASQKKIIEGQKRLLEQQEQSRIIF